MILDERRSKADNVYPVIIRVIHNRKNTSIATGIRVQKDYWDEQSSQLKRTHPNFSVVNPTLLETYLKVQRVIHQLEEVREFSFEALKERLSEQPEASKVYSKVSFNEFSKNLVQDLISINRSGNAIVYRTASNRLITFADNKQIKFKDIDYNLLEGFKNSLVKDGVKTNTVHNYFRTIRAIYNKAIKAKLIDRSFYPFHDVKVKLERTAKRAVPVDCIKKLHELELKTNARQWHARNYFILSFSLIGISFTDMAYLTSKSIIKGRLIYKRRKTHKTYDIKLTAIAIQIFKLYQGRNSKYLLPILPSSVAEDSMEAKKIISQWIKTTNKWLRKIGEDCGLEDDLTTYVTRHSWATCAKRLGYSIELIAEAMGHEHGNRITNIYLDSFDQSVVDEVNEKVIKSIE
ncbi:phage integrase SAM-like domain-containing protein [Rubrolithibacter danxiaensis]|uniref:phage integrase SAM-like domain-containing protein n=1 Tax=Rubrolithibacter danxiaensis TaxID=3390805 RepID=UPI003BF85F89